MTQRLIIVGGGIVGSLHAWEAVRRGFDVRHLDADAEPRGATVRNHGLVWITGRAHGPDLELALRGRKIWAQIAEDSDLVLRPAGGLTVLYTDTEVKVAEEAVQKDDGQREFELLDAQEARDVNPALQGSFSAALYCPYDAILEPRDVLPAIRSSLAESGRYQWLGGHTVVDFSDNYVVDDHGTKHRGDRIIFCVGARREGIAASLVAQTPLRRVRQQLIQTEPMDIELTTAVSDSLSLYYYPTYDVPSRTTLPARDPVDVSLGLKLTMSQRSTGELTIGGPHFYDEPFDFAGSARWDQRVVARAERVLGRTLGEISRRWSGTYSTTPDGRGYLREQLSPSVTLVTAVVLGMTVAPAVAESTFDDLLAR